MIRIRATGVATIALAALSLTGCSLSVSTTPSRAAVGAYYLSVVCPTHRDEQKMDAAAKAQDLAAFTAAAAQSRDDLRIQLTGLTSPTTPWPSSIADKIGTLERSDTELISAFDELAHATTAAEINAVHLPDTTEALKASSQIRTELNLPPTSSSTGGC